MNHFNLAPEADAERRRASATRIRRSLAGARGRRRYILRRCLFAAVKGLMAPGATWATFTKYLDRAELAEVQAATVQWHRDRASVLGFALAQADIDHERR